ncbi:hypothetical protein OF122_13050 [Pelagibacterium flavum]|uniref:Uncharacterized protein n=1 Tax=Pelagibacterium flavum TaxID=2984530 RepID=A0ABY6IK47_9HYPH|nr:hypothetical protein [Pelagibacterium sp. YIM 151497]UYQ70986.1 hypothetical protein OF122_13050 [Pelagibacterium sp. YIM 151497]
MIKPEVLDAMVAAGCTAEQIVAAVKADAQSEDARITRKREMDAARKRRQRENVTLGHADIYGQGVTDAEQNTPDKETSPTPPKENNPKNSPPSGVRTTPAKATPRSELLAVLDAEHAQDVIDHRNRIKKPMTPKAARQLAAKLARCPDPNAAADLMIEKGWQSIEPEWVENRAFQPRGSPQPPQLKGGQHFTAFGDVIDGQAGNSTGEQGDWFDAPGLPVLTIEHQR